MNLITSKLNDVKVLNEDWKQAVIQIINKHRIENDDFGHQFDGIDELEVLNKIDQYVNQITVAIDEEVNSIENDTEEIPIREIKAYVTKQVNEAMDDYFTAEMYRQNWLDRKKHN